MAQAAVRVSPRDRGCTGRDHDWKKPSITKPPKNPKCQFHSSRKTRSCLHKTRPCCSGSVMTITSRILWFSLSLSLKMLAHVSAPKVAELKNISRHTGSFRQKHTHRHRGKRPRDSSPFEAGRHCTRPGGYPSVSRQRRVHPGGYLAAVAAEEESSFRRRP